MLHRYRAACYRFRHEKEPADGQDERDADDEKRVAICHDVGIALHRVVQRRKRIAAGRAGINALRFEKLPQKIEPRLHGWRIGGDKLAEVNRMQMLALRHDGRKHRDADRAADVACRVAG